MGFRRIFSQSGYTICLLRYSALVLIVGSGLLSDWFGGKSLRAQSSSHVVYLTQLAVGDLYPKFEVFVSNENDTGVDATINFMDTEGQPMRLSYGGAMQSTISGSIAPHGLARVQIDSSGPLQVGSAEVLYTGGDAAKVSASVNYHINVAGMAGTISTSVEASRAASTYGVSFRNTVGERKVGFAGRNASDTPISLEFLLYDQDNTLRATASPTEWQNMAPKKQLARYGDEIFSPAVFGNDFIGRLEDYDKHSSTNQASAQTPPSQPQPPSTNSKMS